ncbi:MAG: 2-oxo acid dehydrogenase subunit E2, partial [Rhodobacterales bacterium]|nr:2-oxo acid dehydrogenase subunit E2 [Rhodobacterales bacterium]
PAAAAAASTPPVPATPAPAGPTPPTGGKIRATPLARRLAKNHGLDLAAIAAQASGPRVRRKDVEAFLAAGAPTAAPAPAPETGGADRLVKLSGMRAIIADKMLASTRQAAQAYMTASVDATRLVAARAAMVPAVERATGVRPTLTDLMMKVTAAAIGKHPIINTRWTDDGILWLDRLHMGMAMALDDGLIVPVIPDVGAKSVADIARTRADLVARGRAGGLPPEAMRGSTFTLTSLGMYGVEEFNGIINQPESAILAVGAIIDTPVAVDGAVVVRPVMKVTLTYDHRIIDGAKAGAFLMTLKSMLEEPVLALS